MLTRLRTPFVVFLNVTNRCNLKCVYCSADANSNRVREFSREEMSHVLRELKRAQVCKVIITGGEPLVRPDLFDVLGTLKEYGILVDLLTNGVLIDEHIARELAALEIKRVCVSLDGPTADVNDLTRGGGSFDRAVRGIHNLVRHGIKPAIGVTISTSNYRYVSTLIRECHSWKVQQVALNAVHRQGRGAAVYNEIALSRIQLEECRAAWKEVTRGLPAFAGGEFHLWLALPERLAKQAAKGSSQPGSSPRLLPCSAAKSQCAVTADGWVLPCNKFVDYKCGNILLDSLTTIWNSDKMKRVASLAECSIEEARGCQECKYRPVCSGGCRAEAYNAFGDMTAPDPSCSVLSDAAVHRFLTGIAPV